MSILQHTDAMNAPDLQVWNNAAFDNEESEGSAIKGSWSNLQPNFLNRSSESLQSDCSKENFSPPGFAKTPFSVKSSITARPLHPNNTTIGNSQGKPMVKKKLLSEEQGDEEQFEPLSVVTKKGFLSQEEASIDSEIEEIENEIGRLNSKLEKLRLQKAERIAAKTIERRGKIVAAKFMEPPKQSVIGSDAAKNAVEKVPSSAAKANLYRRGMSLGPSEIFAGGGGLRRLSGKQEITPVQPIQSRRKSCFWKLQDIDELRVTKERRKSMSVSPKSRSKTAWKIQAPPKHALTTVSSKRSVKKEDGVLASIQPKKLFKDGGEKSAPAKKPAKPGRVVPSRYNQIGAGKETATNDARKRSLPEDEKEDGGNKRGDKRRGGGGGGGVVVGRSQGTESSLREKKRWEIPTEVVVYRSIEDDDKDNKAAKMENGLPKIKNLRWVNESPRDSGPAKRVAELIGRKYFFGESNQDLDDSSVCQALSFAEEEEDAEE